MPFLPIHKIKKRKLYHTGLNYYLYQQKLKPMTGVEYFDMDGVQTILIKQLQRKKLLAGISSLVYVSISTTQ